ncbi:hypothetical protein ARMSODRAFT_962531 [Armillaria solidipes]|uniref:Uncharacterized protein n=1 Tax=Armillaria solidipes TaxID=1076256 RepID=A0A2H3BAK2_9AGAR|nr:hypothetical protein ARMSODRAFT_962531 [Armillaria solidipes]
MGTELLSTYAVLYQFVCFTVFVHTVFHGPQISHRQFEGTDGMKQLDSSLRIHGQTTSDTQQRLLKTLHYSRSRSNYPPGLSKGSIVAIGLAVKYPYKIASLSFVSPLRLEERLRWLAANIRVLRALGPVSPIWRSSPICSTVSCSYASIITWTAWRTRAYTGTSCSIMTHCHFSLATIIYFHLEGSCSRAL